MNIFLTSILTLIVSLFFPSPPKYEIISNKIVAKTSEKMSSTYNLFLMGTGGGMMNDVEMLSISYGTKQRLDVRKGREIIFQCTKQLLDNVNNNEEIRKDLHNYPFISKNIEIRIFCQNNQGEVQEKPHLAYISIINGKIIYETYVNNNYYRILSETYSEAEKILQTQNKK